MLGKCTTRLRLVVVEGTATFLVPTADNPYIYRKAPNYMQINPSLRIRLLVTLNALALTGVLVMNILANALPINGRTTGEVSALYSNLFVPAGYTFTIWGLIYIFLIVFVAAQIISLWQSNQDQWRLLSRIGPLFSISCIANMAWIIAWHHEEMALSMALMVVLLVSLTGIYLRVRTGTKTLWVRTAYEVPFSLYLGWICVATIANAAAWLIAIGWEVSPSHEPIWAKGMILTAGLLGLFFLLGRKDLLAGLTIAWGVGGIFVRHYLSDDDWQVGRIALGVAIALMAAVFFRVYRLMMSK